MSHGVCAAWKSIECDRLTVVSLFRVNRIVSPNSRASRAACSGGVELHLDDVA